VLIVLTNWAWIPFILYYDVTLRAAMRRDGASVAATPARTHA